MLNRYSKFEISCVILSEYRNLLGNAKLQNGVVLGSALKVIEASE